jgi:hypothetical protein
MNLSGITPRAYRDLIAKAVDQGWTASSTGGGHIRLDPPGKGGPIFAAFSSGGGRGVQNLRSMLRKRGVDC